MKDKDRAEASPSSGHLGLALKIAIIWLGIFLLVGFAAATRSVGSTSMSVVPEVPKTGEPVVATFDLANSSDESLATDYQLYVNGRLIESGKAVLAPQDSTRHQYAYRESLDRGEQVNFVLKTSSSDGDTYQKVALPAYPSQLMSSFVSFAAFSTSVMSSMISMEYFSDTFGVDNALNVGAVVAIVLLILLIFLELTQAATAGGRRAILGSYRVSFGALSTILFIIFVGMVFTKVVVMLAT